MAVEYTWTIANLEHNTADGGVVVAHWRCEGTDGEHSSSAYGTVGFTPDATAEGFVPYENLTEADVLAWVHGSVDKDATEAAIAAKIDALANPTTTTGTPW
jgi:hypothetical protein